MDLIYPSPSWDERVQKLYAYWQPAEKAIVGIAVIFMFFTACIMVFVAICADKHRVIKAASPPFLLLFLFGSLLLYTGPKRRRNFLLFSGAPKLDFVFFKKKTAPHHKNKLILAFSFVQV